MSAFDAIFSWPYGGVWSNLIASLIWIIPGYIVGKWHLNKINNRLDIQIARDKILHKKIDEIHTKVGIKK